MIKAPPTYRYSFLKADEIDERVVEQFNELIRQLDNNAKGEINIRSLVTSAYSGMVIAIARANGTIVATGTASIVHQLSSSYVEIAEIVVDLQHRRRGVATEILELLYRECRVRSFPKAFQVDSDSLRPYADQFFAKHGFTPSFFGSNRLVIRK